MWATSYTGLIYRGLGVIALLLLIAMAVYLFFRKKVASVTSSSRMELLERVQLDVGSAICLVRIDSRELVVATATNQTPRMISIVKKEHTDSSGRPNTAVQIQRENQLAK